VSDRARAAVTLVSLAVLLVASLLVATACGSVVVPFESVLASVAAALHLPSFGLTPATPVQETILWTVRLPRVVLAALVGGGLAVVGATLQAVFRNPIADSGLLGVGSGAALGAVCAIKLGWAASVFLALPLAAFAGAMTAVLAVYVLAHAQGRGSIQGLILTGLAVSALASAGTSALLVVTEEYRVKTVLFWLVGGLEGRSWAHVELGLLILLGCSLLVALSRPVDLLSLGEDEAASLGLPVHVARLSVLALSSLVAGTATAVAGAVSFIGLMAPHALRPLVGPLSRRLLPAAFLGGGLLLVLADLAARTLSTRFDLPLGSLTALVGAPYFLFALRGSVNRE